MQRVRVDELMDDPGIEPAVHARALAGLARLNAWARSDRLPWPTIAREARARGGAMHVMDLACGSADGPIRIAARAARAGLRLRWTLVDARQAALDEAARRAKAAGVPATTLLHDVVRDGVPGEADVVGCSLFVHHLDRPQAVALLQAMRSAARCAVVVADLDRSVAGLVLASAASRILSRSPVVHFDAPASVRAAFTPEEALAMADEAGMHGARITRAWPARWVLDWRRA